MRDIQCERIIVANGMDIAIQSMYKKLRVRFHHSGPFLNDVGGQP